MPPTIFEKLCFRFKAGDDATPMKEPLLVSAAVDEAGASPVADFAPQENVAQDSSSNTEEQIHISTGT